MRRCFSASVGYVIVLLISSSGTWSTEPAMGPTISKPYPHPVPCPGPAVEVRGHNGAPALFIDGKPTAPILANPNQPWGEKPRPVIEQGKLILTNEPGNYNYRSVKTTQHFGTRYNVEARLGGTEITGKNPIIRLEVQQRGKRGKNGPGGYCIDLATIAGNTVVRVGKNEPSKNDLVVWSSSPLDWPMGGGIDLKIVVDDKTVSMFINGAPIIEKTDEEPLRPGSVGLSVYHAVVEIDVVTVKKPDGEVLFQDDFSKARSWDWSGQPLHKAKNFHEAGIHLYTAVGWGGTDVWSKAWNGPGEYDFSWIDEHQFGRVAKQDPQARFLPRLYLDPPKWWLEAHPEEAAGCFHTAGWEGKDRRASFTSERWLKDTSDYLRQYLRHLNSSAYADRFIGFVLGGGHALEWVYNWQGIFFHDYSQRQACAFRGYLRDRYGSVGALRQAWKDPAVTFETAEIPTPEQRQSSDSFNFYDPAKGRQLPDYMRFHSMAVSRAILHFSRVVREETQGKRLILHFYGYHLNTQQAKYMNMGHQDFGTTLRSNDIDAFCSPHFYALRQPGEVIQPVVPLDSVRLHGKLFFDEDDIRTHLAARTPLAISEGRAETLDQTINVMKRDFAYCTSKNIPFWWMDWGNGWYNDDAIMDLVAKIQEIATESLDRDRGPSAEIAVVVSEKSVDYLRASVSLMRPLVFSQVCEQLHRIGAPFDICLLSDLPLLEEHKLYIFLDTFYLTEEDESNIRDILKNNHTVLWMYAPGYVTDRGLCIDSSSNITGIKLAALRRQAECYATLEDVSDSVTQGLDPGLRWGVEDGPYGPVIFADDNEATVLATLHAPAHEDNKTEALTRPGLVVRQFPDWRSIWCGVPDMPASLLRNIARTSGVHIYTDSDDVLYANRFMVAIHTRLAGKRTIHLPQKATLIDAFSGKKVAEDTAKFEVELGQYETGFWLIEK